MSAATQEDTFLDACPYKSRLVLFVMVKSGQMRQANDVTGKRALASERGGTLSVVWPGQWSTTARSLTAADRKRVLEALA